MCVQCMMGAMTAAAGSTGLRSVVAAKVKNRRLVRFATIVLLVAGLLASTLLVSSPTPPA